MVIRAFVLSLLSPVIDLKHVQTNEANSLSGKGKASFPSDNWHGTAQLPWVLVSVFMVNKWPITFATGHSMARWRLHSEDIFCLRYIYAVCLSIIPRKERLVSVYRPQRLLTNSKAQAWRHSLVNQLCQSRTPKLAFERVWPKFKKRKEMKYPYDFSYVRAGNYASEISSFHVQQHCVKKTSWFPAGILNPSIWRTNQVWSTV